MKQRLGLGLRRADDWSSPHERARTRAAQRLDWELDPAENEWLEAHLSECERCRAVADEHGAIHGRLQDLRSQMPPPPRDLWARTAAAIEQEAARPLGGRRAPSRRLPLGALSGALVVLVVVGASLLANLPLRPVSPNVPNPTGTELAIRITVPPSEAPAGTPLAVGAGDVRYVSRESDGTYGINVARVDEVCPEDDADCPVLEDARETAVALLADPESIVGSPDNGHAVVIAGSGGEAADVYVMPLPTDGGVDTSASAGPSTEPFETEGPSVPPASAEPPASDPPATSDSPTPSDQPTPGAEATESAAPTPSDTPEPTASEEPSLAPEAITIARNLVVTTETAAYSADGQWFAFTARPADGSHGPDIYVWRADSDEATPVTEDHRSVFGSWIGDRIVGSRTVDPDEPDESGAPSDGAGAAQPDLDVETFLLDPRTGDTSSLAAGSWRPTVSPNGDFAVAWNGTVLEREGTIGPAAGRLELQRWSGADGPVDPADAVVLADDDAVAFDARWDDSGDALAVWTEDPANPGIGRLSLYFVDPETGELDQPKHAPRDVAALAGFSIGEGRLAWVTPQGQGGEGSRVLIVAWTDDGVGRVESAPGDEVLVIR